MRHTRPLSIRWPSTVSSATRFTWPPVAVAPSAPGARGTTVVLAGSVGPGFWGVGASRPVSGGKAPRSCGAEGSPSCARARSPGTATKARARTAVPPANTRRHLKSLAVIPSMVLRLTVIGISTRHELGRNVAAGVPTARDRLLTREIKGAVLVGLDLDSGAQRLLGRFGADDVAARGEHGRGLPLARAQYGALFFVPHLPIDIARGCAGFGALQGDAAAFERQCDFLRLTSGRAPTLWRQ